MEESVGELVTYIDKQTKSMPTNLDGVVSEVMSYPDHLFYLAMYEYIWHNTRFGEYVLSRRKDAWKRLRNYQNSGLVKENPYFEIAPPGWRNLWGLFADYKRVKMV